MNIKKMATTCLVAAVLTGGIQTARWVSAQKKTGAKTDQTQYRSRGLAEAEFQVEEFTDFQCPACARGAKTLHQYFKKFPRRLQMTYHHFPLASHQKSRRISVAAECAGRQDRFWDYHDTAFDRQRALYKTVRLDGRLTDIARELELDVPAFEKCLADPAVELAVLAGKKDGILRGVQATPTYFINGEMVVGSTRLLEYLKNNLGALDE